MGEKKNTDCWLGCRNLRIDEHVPVFVTNSFDKNLEFTFGERLIAYVYSKVSIPWQIFMLELTFVRCVLRLEKFLLCINRLLLFNFWHDDPGLHVIHVFYHRPKTFKVLISNIFLVRKFLYSSTTQHYCIVVWIADYFGNMSSCGLKNNWQPGTIYIGQDTNQCETKG